MKEGKEKLKEDIGIMREGIESKIRKREDGGKGIEEKKER